MTPDEYEIQAGRLSWLSILAKEYEEEHDWDNDEDPTATHDMLREVRAIYSELMAALPTPPEFAVTIPDKDLPF